MPLHRLAVAQHTLLVHDETDGLARYAGSLLGLERGATVEVAALVEGDRPGEACLERVHGFVHVLAVIIIFFIASRAVRRWNMK